MLQLFFLILLLIICFCNSINIELIINENYLKTRQFNYLINSKNIGEQILKCSLFFKYRNEKNIIKGELKNNNIYLFRNIPEEFYFVKDGQIFRNNNYFQAEFRFELPINFILLKSILITKNQNIWDEINLIVRTVELNEKLNEFQPERVNFYENQKSKLLKELNQCYENILYNEKLIISMGKKEAIILLYKIINLILSVQQYRTHKSILAIISGNILNIKYISEYFNEIVIILFNKGRENLFNVLKEKSFELTQHLFKIFIGNLHKYF
uniref:Uncharacterized protein n=1 Tax=Meloidogyne hapla TaxID=6305 RepID=A0A1I8B757_MELHA